MLSATFQPLISAAVTTIEVAGGLVVGVVVASKSFDWLRSVVSGSASDGDGVVYRDIEGERRAPTIEDHEASGFHDVVDSPVWFDNYEASSARVMDDEAFMDGIATTSLTMEDYEDAGWHDAGEDE